MWHPAPEALAAAKDPRVLAHIAECPHCRAVFAAIHDPGASDRFFIRLRNPALRPRRWLWATAAACIVAGGVGLLLPPPSSSQLPVRRTYLHIDFARPGGYILADGSIETIELGGKRMSIANAATLPGGWTAISIKLTEPVRIERECVLRMSISTNAGYVVAQLFPLGRDATFLRFSPDSSAEATLTARVRPGEKVGTTLKAGDTIDWITIVAPATDSTTMLVHAIELESLP